MKTEKKGMVVIVRLIFGESGAITRLSPLVATEGDDPGAFFFSSLGPFTSTEILAPLFTSIALYVFHTRPNCEFVSILK